MRAVIVAIKIALVAANIYFASKVAYAVGRGAMICDFAEDLGSIGNFDTASEIANGEFCTTGLVGFARRAQ